MAGFYCLDSTGLTTSSSVPLHLTDGETEAQRVGVMGVALSLPLRQGFAVGSFTNFFPEMSPWGLNGVGVL